MYMNEGGGGGRRANGSEGEIGAVGGEANGKHRIGDVDAFPEAERGYARSMEYIDDAGKLTADGVKFLQSRETKPPGHFLPAPKKSAGKGNGNGSKGGGLVRAFLRGGRTDGKPSSPKRETAAPARREYEPEDFQDEAFRIFVGYLNANNLGGTISAYSLTTKAAVGNYEITLMKKTNGDGTKVAVALDEYAPTAPAQEQFFRITTHSGDGALARLKLELERAIKK